MLRNLKEYVKPKDLKEAITILSKNPEKAKIIAGGTSVVISNNKKIEILIDIKNLNLNYIKKNKNEIIIGATTTINELLESKIIQQYCNGIIHKSAYNIASTPVRNLITVGGNITQVYPWSDLPLSLLLVNAKIKIVNKSKTRIIPILELFQKHPLVYLKNDEIITEIILPENKNYKGNFVKFAKTQFDFALVDAAIMVKIKNKEFEDVKLGISATSPLPQILTTSSNMLIGKKTNDKEAINIALQNTSKEAMVNKDIRVSVEYKREIIPVLLRRLLEEII